MKNQQLKRSSTIENVCYLPNRKILIMTIKSNNSYGENYQTNISCIQYQESITTNSQSFSNILQFYSNPLQNQLSNETSNNSQSLPFLSISYDPTETNVALLHSSGYVTFFQLNNTINSSTQINNIQELYKIKTSLIVASIKIK